MKQKIKVIKPMILSKEAENSIDELSQIVRGNFNQLRSQQINDFLAVHGLTQELLSKKGFVAVIERQKEGDSILLCTIKDSQKLTSFEEFVMNLNIKTS